MRSRLALALMLLLTSTAHSQAAIPVAEEPFHHPVFANDSVRILDVILPAHRTSMMHQHDYDYVYVMLTDGSLTSTREDGSVVTLQAEKGQVRLSRGGFAHRATNDGATPIHILAVELLHGAGAEICGVQLPACDKAEGSVPTHQVLIDTDRIRVSTVHMDPGVGDMHRHEYAHLLIAPRTLRLRNEVAGKPPEILRIKAGDYKWVPGGFTHTLTNSGKTEVDFLVLEFKDEAAPTVASPQPDTDGSPDSDSDTDDSDEQPQQ